MRIYTSIFVLSLLTISSGFDSQIINHPSTKLLKSVNSSQQLSSVQTGEARQKSPSRGGPRRNFLPTQEISAPQISHRGSGRRQFSWA